MADLRCSTRAQYAVLVRIMTRWNDYDLLGHVNNVEYYRYYETAILTLLQETGLDWLHDPVFPLAAENGCQFLRPVSAGGSIEVGVRIAHLGNSSVKYEVAVFVPDEPASFATGFFVHVFIERKTGRPTSIPEFVRAHFEAQRAIDENDKPRWIADARLLPA